MQFVPIIWTRFDFRFKKAPNPTIQLKWHGFGHMAGYIIYFF